MCIEFTRQLCTSTTPGTSTSLDGCSHSDPAFYVGGLAMIGIMGFMAEAKVPGSVPALSGLIKPFAGDVGQPSVGVLLEPSGD